jgi:hypothetical protein
MVIGITQLGGHFRPHLILIQQVPELWQMI